MTVEDDVKNIMESFEKKMDKNQEFYHVLDQIGKHIIKLTRLKENEDRPGHFKEEVADMYLLGKILLELENVNDAELKAASKHFLEKVKSIYG